MSCTGSSRELCKPLGSKGQGESFMSWVISKREAPLRRTQQRETRDQERHKAKIWAGEGQREDVGETSPLGLGLRAGLGSFRGRAGDAGGKAWCPGPLDRH